MTWILDIFKSLLTPIIAAVVAYIAYQQHKTNRDKLMLDLYDRRLKVFEGLMGLLWGIFQKGKCDDQERNKFLRATVEGIFLFDKDIVNYLETIYKKTIVLGTICAAIRILPSGDNRDEEAKKKKSQVLEWFMDQFEVSKVKFGKYLSFRQSENLSERRTMNCKRGFERIAWVLSIVGFLFWVGLGIYLVLTEGWDFDFWIVLAFAFLSFAAIWVVYYVGLYIVKGFCNGRPVDEQKQ